jgi:hypothetical protein
MYIFTFFQEYCSVNSYPRNVLLKSLSGCLSQGLSTLVQSKFFPFFLCPALFNGLLHYRL